MATYNDFIGFQSRWSVNAISERQIVHSITKADACATYCVVARNTSGSTSAMNPVGPPAMGTIANGETGVMRCRVRFRLVVLPSVDKVLFHLNGGASSHMCCGVLITTAGTMQCWTNIASGGPIVTATASAALPMDEWISVDIAITVTNSASLNADTMSVDATLTFADASTEVLANATSTPSALGTPQFGTYSLWSVPSGSGLTTNYVGEIHFSQWIMRAATGSDVASLGTLPPVTARIGHVKATADGAFDEIAGDTFHVFNKRMLFTNLTNDGSRSTSTAGQRASFVHETLASIGGTTTYGIKLIQVGTLASGSGTASFLIGGSATAPSGGSSVGTTITESTVPWYADFTTRNQATFDALECGVVSIGSSVLHRIGVLMFEVLYEGDAYTAEQFTEGGGYRQKVLAWTGDGTEARTLTGVGFRPMGVWVFPSGVGGGGNLGTWMAVEGMTHIADDVGTAASLISFFGFTADGLIVSGQLNLSGQSYTALCLRDEGFAQEGSPGGMGYRWACGTLNQNEIYDFGPVVALTPEVFVGYPARGATSGSSVMKHVDGMAANEASRWNTTTGLSSSNCLASFDANGFTTSTATSILFGTLSCAPFFAWGNLETLHEAMHFRRVPVWGDTLGTPTTGYDVRFSFEDPTDTDIARPTINLLGHGLDTVSSTAVTVAGCVVADTANRGLLVIVTTYGLTGTRTLTFDGDAVPVVYDHANAQMRTIVHYLDNPDAITGDVVWGSTVALNSAKVAVFQINGTYGIRSVHAETSPIADELGTYSRQRDLIVAMMASDPLDSGSTYSETSAWTELFNDGSVSAAAAAWWSTGDETGTNMKSPTIVETGTSDVLLSTFVAFMPAGIPDWDPAIFVIKGNYTTPAVAGVRLNHADYASTSNSTLAASGVTVASGIEALDAFTVSVKQQATTAPYLREAQAWWSAFAEEFIEEPQPPSPGGVVIEGTNPVPFVQPSGVLRTFVEFKFGSGSPFTHLSVAETTLRDPATWYGGLKAGALISVSEIERELTDDGSFRGSECRVIVADDGTFRTLATTDTISNAYAAVYVVSDETRYALGVPTRIFAGRISEHGALPGHKYEFVITDILSTKIAILDASPRVPPERLSVTQFPGMEQEFEGRAAPLVIGVLSDTFETGNFPLSGPQGVVPPVILGVINLQVLGGPDLEVIAAIWSTGALAANGVWEVFYNTPTDTMVRIPVDPAAWGTIIWSPGQPGWAALGATTEYVDYPAASAETRRYTPFFILNSHAYATAVREGRILVAGNLYGIEETGEGTGLYFSDAPRIWQWLIVNMLFEPYRFGAYAEIPLLDDTYSIIDTDTVEAATVYLRSRLAADEYPVGFVLGRGGSQQTLRHVLQELCGGVLMEQGINRHGQLMVSVEDPSAAATVALGDLLDIEDGMFQVWIDRGAWCDRIEYSYGFRYVPMWAPPPTPPEGEALPARPLPPYHDWTSGLQVMESTAAIAANQGEVRTRTIENYVVRNADVADDVTERLLERSTGPAPMYDGPRRFRLTTSWQGLAVELGTVIGITHVEGLGATGYEGERGYVTKIGIDPQRARITIEGRILGAP